MIFENKQTVVFTGDSTTDAGRKRPYGEGLWEGVGNGYVRIVDSALSVLYPEKFIRIVNTGTNGFTSRDLLSNWEHDVTALSPDWVFIMIGANDVWRKFDEPCVGSCVDIEEYRKNLCKMIDKTISDVKGMLIMGPFYMEASNKDLMKIEMKKYAAVAKEVADEKGCAYVDLQSAFDEHLKYRYPAYISWDRIHPNNNAGAMIIAKEVLKAIKAKPLY